jgi:hypothetical protein
MKKIFTSHYFRSVQHHILHAHTVRQPYFCPGHYFRNALTEADWQQQARCERVMDQYHKEGRKTEPTVSPYSQFASTNLNATSLTLQIMGNGWYRMIINELHTIKNIFQNKSKVCAITKFVQHKQELFLSFEFHPCAFNVSPTGELQTPHSKHWRICVFQMIHKHPKCEFSVHGDFGALGGVDSLTYPPKNKSNWIRVGDREDHTYDPPLPIHLPGKKVFRN